MIEKGYFFFEITETNILDLGDMSPKDWREVKKRSKMILNAKQTENSEIAFVAAFMHLMMEKQQMSKPFQIDA